jgi:hypothetical protein
VHKKLSIECYNSIADVKAKCQELEDVLGKGFDFMHGLLVLHILALKCSTTDHSSFVPRRCSKI